MNRKERKFWDVFIETICIIGAVIYFVLQFYSGMYYKLEISDRLMRMLTMFLLYSGLTILQMHPELMNIGCEDCLEGKVRIYAIRMMRMIKLIIVVGMLIPSLGDVFGLTLNAAYSLIIAICIVLNIAYYLYHIWKHNKSQHKH
ncbi:MAG: hypothetical protein ACK5ML_08275 [Lachnospiraceae bacterium]